MSPSVEPCREDLPHEQVEPLLPWYVNQSLEATERERVRAHLAHCPACREEVAKLGAFAEGLVRSKVPALSPQASFARLRNRLDRRRPSWSECWRRLPEWRPGFARLAFTLALLLVALPLGFRQWRDSTEPRFHTLADPGSGGWSAEGDIRVLFDETLGPERIAALLRGAGGVPVGGPDAAGVYTVRLAAGTEIEGAVARLRGQAGVLLVEPLMRP